MWIDYLLTLIIPLTSVIIWEGKNKLQNNADELFSKDYTTVLKGVCCIIVVMVHVKGAYQNILQDTIGSFGFVCVTLFFMVSAYGMQRSVERKPNYLRHFWRNRLLALLIPCLLINICFYLINRLSGGNASVKTLLHINNYVVVLLGYCLWFYLVMKAKEWLKIQHTWMTDLLLATGVILSSLYSYYSVKPGVVSAELGWCYERWGLVWGLLMYRFLPIIKQWLVGSRMKKLILFSFLALVVGVAYLKYKDVYFYGEYLLKITLGIVIITWMLLLTVKRKYGNRISLYLGNISYEVYLSHGMVMSVLASFCPQLSSGMFIFITYLVTILFSMGIYSISSRLVKKWRYVS